MPKILKYSSIERRAQGEKKTKAEKNDLFLILFTLFNICCCIFDENSGSYLMTFSNAYEQFDSSVILFFELNFMKLISENNDSLAYVEEKIDNIALASFFLIAEDFWNGVPSSHYFFFCIFIICV